MNLHRMPNHHRASAAAGAAASDAKAEIPRTASASVETDRPDRYLAQLCQHIRAAAGPHGAQVECSDEGGTVAFGWGFCTLRSRPGVLDLRVEAGDDAALKRAQHLLGNLVERMGRRDGLIVNWTTPTD